jgi:hypothetical protein
MAHFIGIQGLLGAGKTTTASFMAHYYRNRVRARGGDIKLFSNYGLYGATEMDHHDKWFDVADAHGSVCVWDEGQTQFDARQWSKGDQIFSTQLLNYCRKMNSVQIIIAPNFMNIESRIRQLTEVLINVVKIGKKGMRLEYYDFQAGNAKSTYGHFMHSRFIPAWKVKQIHALNLFDTYRMVRGFPMPTTERQQKAFWEELEQRHEAALIAHGLRRPRKEMPPVEIFDSATQGEERSAPAALSLP